jgi:hypothetical protein
MMPADSSHRAPEPLAVPPRPDLQALPVRGLNPQEVAPIHPRAAPGDAALAHDIDIILAELRRLEVEPARFLRIVRPVQAAMVSAVTRTVAELEARQGDKGRPALVALAEAAALRAAQGSLPHAVLVADRLEGRAGLRPDNTEPESLDERAAIRETIERIVGALTEAKLGTSDDTAHGASRARLP